MNGFADEGTGPVVDLDDTGSRAAGSASASATAGDPPAAAAATGAAAPRRSLASRISAILGEALITFGLLAALYAVYELWWTNVTADQQVRQNSASLLHAWSKAPPPAAPPATLAETQSFGFMYVPALGPDWQALLMQGVDRVSVLNTGAVGHYPTSALPWQPTGNFAVAGHRDGHGMIFRDLNELKPGDKVYIETDYGWFIYQLDREAPSVSMNDVAVLDPVPAGSGYTAPGRYITLTTCTPMYLDTSRLIWWGHFIGQTPHGVTPPGVTPLS